MTPEYVRQTETPLHPQVLYNRPVTRSGAGRLLLAGGHSGNVATIMSLYELAMAAGAGECIVALPDALARLIGGAPSTTFVASSPSGSLGREALGRLLELSEDMDAVLLGAGLSANSETAIVLERFVSECERPIIAFDEAISLMLPNPAALIGQPHNLLVLTMPQVFKLADHLGVPVQIRPHGGLANKLEIIGAVKREFAAAMLVYGTEIITITSDEPPVVTPCNYLLSQHEAVYAALASVFWLQNPGRRGIGLATAAYVAARLSYGLREGSGATVTALAGLIRAQLAADGF